MRTHGARALRFGSTLLRPSGFAAVCLMLVVMASAAGARGEDRSTVGMPTPIVLAQAPAGDDDGLERFERLHREAQVRIQPDAFVRGVDYRYTVARTVVLGLALLAYASVLLPGAHRFARARRVALVLLAATAYASYYQFFLQARPSFATNDSFHYYLGSKYADELGYYGLYECALYAASQRGIDRPGAHERARDLRTMELSTVIAVRSDGSTCPARFSPQRWEQFADDVAWFGARITPGNWKYLFGDHGYHPSPVWTAIGGRVANALPTSNETAMVVLARLDRVIVAATIAIVAWAFGLEAACLVAILWGTGYLWRYAWLGDVMLRHLWWAAALTGVALLRRGWFATAGAALSLSATLRLFPAALPLCLVVHFVRRALAERALPAGFVRVCAGGIAGAVLLVAFAIATSARGASLFVDFADKIWTFSLHPAVTALGLRAVGDLLFPDSPLAIFVHAALAVVFVALIWRALDRCEAWEAAALGFALIPVVTAPVNYYWSFLVLAGLFAARRPWIGVVALGTALLLDLDGLVFFYDYDSYRYASLIACSGVLATLVLFVRVPSEGGRTAAVD